MSTKFIKVPTAERLPEEGSVQIYITEGGIRKITVYRKSWFEEERYSLLKYWLEEVEDREDEMREMLERVLAASRPHNELSGDMQDEIEQLLNKQ